MNIATGPSPRYSSPLRTPAKAALVHIGSRVAEEAMVGVAYAGVVMLGDSVGLGAISRVAVSLVGGARGLSMYKTSAIAALDSPVLGKTLAFTLGASTALMAAMSGNILSGAAFGAGLGLISSAKSYFPRQPD